MHSIRPIPAGLRCEFCCSSQIREMTALGKKVCHSQRNRRDPPCMQGHLEKQQTQVGGREREEKIEAKPLSG